MFVLLPDEMPGRSALRRRGNRDPADKDTGMGGKMQGRALIRRPGRIIISLRPLRPSLGGQYGRPVGRRKKRKEEEDVMMKRRIKAPAVVALRTATILFAATAINFTIPASVAASGPEALAGAPAEPQIKAQAKAAAQAADKGAVTPELLSGLVFRNIGPALMSGRISDIVIHPQKRSTWYVAVGSGGVWKTENAGTTWVPIFDGEGSYSIGCLALDPANPEVVWVGTGENVSGRHVGIGDGVYKSLNGGRTWTNIGLARSEHIGRILVDPRDPRVVYAAAEGPLWSSGGDRGLYKTADGGRTWTLSLAISADTGVTSAEFDPGNPDILYAAAYQRRRSVAAFMGGGPESGIYKSEDAGRTWRKLTVGLPKGDVGKIGLAVSPLDPRVVYATVEAGPDEKGFYRSADRGESWEKRSSYISGGTGPHYYQEIFADPNRFDRVYQMDPGLRVTDDGGRTWRRVPERNKHGDNHAMAFVKGEPGYILNGSDGGVYESHDEGATWRFFENLPVTQFYKLALDNDLPFYNVHGGTQDNGSQLGPSRTLNANGITNFDWTITFGADGYASAIDPGDPNIIYLEWQEGNLLRYDRRSHETVYISPCPGRASRPALQLGFSGHRQPPLPDADLLRLPVPVAERRPGRLVDEGQPRPDPGHLPPRAADHGPALERRRALGPRRNVDVQHDHDDLRVAARGGPDLRRHGRRPHPGDRGRRPDLEEDRPHRRGPRLLLRQRDQSVQAR
jgi:hypothetical protein